jgi:predicted Zn-dependent protease
MEIGILREDIVLHEVGHCIGLGHSTHPWSVMQPHVRLDSLDGFEPRVITHSDRRLAERLVNCE